MNAPLAAHGPVAIDLNAPGRYLTWSIFTISVANLVLIAVMVAIFGIALLAPFPGRRRGPVTSAETEPGDALEPADPAESADGADPLRIAASRSDADDADARMWTARVRRRALSLLPPGKLLPDRQPAYVASWVYVFGVATLAALGMAIVSGFVIALGGTDWWHINPVGHFFNSMHLWSVELFMAFMVIHLWGKFWMAAWRGRRALTWITGVVAFIASVLECFTGYLSQQNFDSQWIATNGKDAFNAAGIGAFFNLMNFGQMLLWHVVLIPILLVSLAGAHVLLVRASRPSSGRDSMRHGPTGHIASHNGVGSLNSNSSPTGRRRRGPWRIRAPRAPVPSQRRGRPYSRRSLPPQPSLVRPTRRRPRREMRLRRGRWPGARWLRRTSGGHGDAPGREIRVVLT